MQAETRVVAAQLPALTPELQHTRQKRVPPMPIEPQIGTWYIVTTCEQCHSKIFLFRDLTNGAGSLNAIYCVSCPQCRHLGEYEGQHYQHRDADHLGHAPA